MHFRISQGRNIRLTSLLTRAVGGLLGQPTLPSKRGRGQLMRHTEPRPGGRDGLPPIRLPHVPINCAPPKKNPPGRDHEFEIEVANLAAPPPREFLRKQARIPFSTMSPNPYLLAADNPTALVTLLQEQPSLAAGQDDYGYSLVHAAASYNHLDLLRQLVHVFKVPVDLTDEDGETALFIVETVEAARVLVGGASSHNGYNGGGRDGRTST
jgi:hypothetical protein